jgi:hypothetical protein
VTNRTDLCRLAAALSATTAVMLAPSVATADTYTVGTTGDTSSSPCPTATASCSLRQLILYVEAHPFPPDTITVPPGTYTLSLGALTIDQSVSIDGAGANLTVIEEPIPSDRSSAGDRVFDIGAVSGGITPTVSLAGIEVAGGDANPANSFFGGDIRSTAVLTLTDDWITDGFACSGGGVGNSAGILTIERSLISGNHAACTGGDSGGVENFGTPGSPDLPGHLLIDDSTIAGNDARLVGGVFSWNDPNDTMTVENSTIADNASQDEPSGAARGGGGGLGLGNGTGRVENTILAGNVEITGGVTTSTNCAPGPGLTSLGRNIDTGTDCGLADTIPGQTDQSETNPQLGPLQNNGGPTMTIALGRGSPALDKVPAAAANCPSTDQRGVPRPQGSACDIGAFELQDPPTCSAKSAKTAAGGSTISISLSCSSHAPGALTFAVVTNPHHGKLSSLSAAGGTVGYTPAKGFHGTDSFNYTAANSGGFAVPATVTVIVPPLLPPRVTITKASVSFSGHRAKFTFKATAPGAKSFQCALVRTSGSHHPKASFTSCRSPKTYMHLAAASYTFSVRSVGVAGKGKAATKKFKIA